MINEETNCIKPVEKNNLSPINRECWICMTEDTRPFLRPCLCRGSTKYVHSDCFESFIMTKNLENFRCNFCKAEYRIKIPFKHFIMCYEMGSRITGHLCTWIFILTIASLTYILLFLYGLSVIISFAGLINFNHYFLREMGLIKYGFRLMKLVLGAPILPIYLCLSVNQKFSFVTHVIPLLLLADCVSIVWIKFYAIIIVFYLYCRVVQYLQGRLGHIPVILGGIVINNHQIAIKELVFALMSPFLGSFFGKMLFNLKRPARNFMGMFLVIFVKDMFRIGYLSCRMRFLSSIRVLEYTD